MNTITDQELLTRHLSDHDPAALRELMARHGPMVYATARRLAPADAEDVTQAVFLLLWQKAPKGMYSVAGWLYRATRYACRNANKVKGRREHYEREAAMLRREVTEAAEPQVRALLDEGLSRLGETNRQAVILRYLEGLSVEETAGRLGMTPRAAGKRAERGVEKLRAFMGSKGYSTVAASLAGAMAVEAAHALPQALLTGLEQVVAGGVTGGNVASLTVAAAKAMIMAKVKMVVLAMGMTALVGIGVVGGLKLMAVSEPAKTVQTVLPAPVGLQVVAEDESKTPGSPRVFRHQLVIEQGLCDAIVKDATKVASQGQWQFYRMPMASLREWVVGAPQGRVDFAYEHAEMLTTPKAATDQQPVFGEIGYAASFNSVKPNLYSMMRGSLTDRIWADATGVHIAKDSELRTDINGIPGGSITKSGKLSADAVLRPGETLAAVVKLGQLKDREYSLMVAMDVFNATDIQAYRIAGIHETDSWMRYGPGLCRRIADRASAWQSGGHGPDEVPVRWRRTLSDGTVVQLSTIACGSRWPGISWDGDGKAVGGDTTIWSGQQDTLMVRGHVEAVTAPMAQIMNSRGNNMWGWCNNVQAGSRAYKMRVPVGPFANAGRLERGKAMQVGPLSVGLREIEKGDREWRVEVYISGTGPDRSAYAIAPVVVTRSGKRIGPEQNMSEEYFYDPEQQLGAVSKEPVSLRFPFRSASDPSGKDEADHLELLWRKVEIVTFEGFATAPAGAEMADLEKAVKDARRPVVGKAAGVAPLAPTPAAKLPDGQRPAESMQLLVAAIAAGDLAEMQKYLIGDEKACKTFIDVMLATHQLLDAVKKRLGTVPDVQGLTEWASFDWNLLKDEYKVRDDGIAVCGQTICRRAGQGVWKLDLDQSFNGDFARARMQEGTQAGLPMVRGLTEELNSGKITTADQLSKAFANIIKDVKKTQAQ